VRPSWVRICASVSFGLLSVVCELAAASLLLLCLVADLCYAILFVLFLIAGFFDPFAVCAALVFRVLSLCLGFVKNTGNFGIWISTIRIWMKENAFPFLACEPGQDKWQQAGSGSHESRV